MKRLPTSRPIVGLSLLVCGIVISLISTSASAALFLNFDGINGDSQDAQHTDWINILTVNWNISVAKTIDDGSGKTAPEPVFSDINWTQEQDSSFPSLFDNISNGTLIKSAEVDFTTPGGKGDRVYFQLEFEDVQLTNLSLSADGLAPPLISGAFSFGKVVVTYLPQDETGKELPPLSAVYDLVKNSGSAANVASLFAQGLSGPVASPVPLPAAILLFVPALIGLLTFRKI